MTRFTVGPPFTAGSWPRLSPDGRFVVFGAIVEGRNRFWVRALDDVQGRALMNTTANESPFWSPDGRVLCFFADGKLQRIPVQSDGLQPEVLADALQPHGGDWSGRTILFARAGGVYRIALEENVVVSRVTTVEESLGEYQHAWPEFLPDGRRFLFVIRSSRPDRTGVYLASIDGGVSQRVMPVFSRVRYVDGHLLFVRQGILLAQRFDAASATLDGEPVPLADRVTFHAEGDGAFDVSESGVLVYGRSAYTSGESGTPEVYVEPFPATGSRWQISTHGGGEPHWRRSGRELLYLSPDGMLMAAGLTTEGWERSRPIALFRVSMPDLAGSGDYTVSPDGERIVVNTFICDPCHPTYRRRRELDRAPAAVEHAVVLERACPNRERAGAPGFKSSMYFIVDR